MLFVYTKRVSNMVESIEESTYTPVMQVNCFPVRVLSGVECPPVGVELVAEHKLHLVATLVRNCRVRAFWRVHVN